MSERTPCNWCTLQDVKQRYPRRRVTVKYDPRMGMLRVWAGRTPLGIWFVEVSNGCCC